MIVGSNRTWLATDQTRPAHVHRVEIAQSLWWMSFEDSIRIHASAHVRRLVQCGRAKRGNSLPCPQKTRPCHNVAKAAGLGWNWSPQCKYLTCLLALSGSRVSTWYKKIRKKSLRVNCEGCLAAWRRLSNQGWCKRRWAGQERAPWGSKKGHPSAPPIPVEHQTSRRGDEGQTQTHAFKSQQNWLVSHQSTNAATTQARNSAGTLNSRFSSWQWGNRGKGECREQGHQGHTHTHTHAHTHTPMFVARKGMATKIIIKRYHVEPQTMDVDGDGANRNPCISKDSEDADEDASQHQFPATAATVNTKGRASCAARVLSCLQEKSLGRAMPNVRHMWMSSWSGAEQGHCLSQCKAVNPKQPWQK